MEMTPPAQQRAESRYTDILERLRMTRLLPILLVTIGLALMVRKIHVENEPGAMPLALITLGVAAYFLARIRHRRSQRQHR